MVIVRYGIKGQGFVPNQCHILRFEKRGREYV